MFFLLKNNMANRKFYIEYTSNNSLERETIRDWANKNRPFFLTTLLKIENLIFQLLM